LSPIYFKYNLRAETDASKSGARSPKRDNMKKCPFCAEEIQDEAIKCKHCGEFLDRAMPTRAEKEKLPWYFGTTFIVIAVLSVGPLALPLIWWHPRATKAWKIGLTIGILILSWIIYKLTMQSVETIMEYYKLLNSL
jgi:hypothetical protein